jgi:hypothetical protein
MKVDHHFLSQIWTKCGGCEPTCFDLSPPCSTQCRTSRCQCQTGYVRDTLSGRCIVRQQCPQVAIGGGNRGDRIPYVIDDATIGNGAGGSSSIGQGAEPSRPTNGASPPTIGSGTSPMNGLGYPIGGGLGNGIGAPSVMIQ